MFWSGGGLVVLRLRWIVRGGLDVLGAGGRLSGGRCELAYGGVVNGGGAALGRRRRRMVRRGAGIAAGCFPVARLRLGAGGRVARVPSAPGELASYRLPTGRAGLRFRDGYLPRGSGARARNFAEMHWMHRGRNPTEVRIACRTWGPEMPVCLYRATS